MILLLISFLLLFPYTALLIYYRQGWMSLEIYNPDKKTNPQNQTFISVIIPARNEEKNIGNCIESILKQTYPPGLFEVIIADDYSVDATAEIAASYKQLNITIIRLSALLGNQVFNSYKKKAVETAIGIAKGSLIVTTDADCIAQPGWLAAIASFYETTGAVFIAAPVVYNRFLQSESLGKKFLNIFQSLDFMMLQGITGASVYRKVHSMCNGANLAYEKKAFYEVGGFQGIDDIASGDDMLLMHKIQKIYSQKISYIKSPDVIVQTQAASSLNEFINQRIRWASKAGKYPDFKITAVLFLVYFFNAWIFFLLVYSFFFTPTIYICLLLFFIKTGVELIFLFPVAGFFKRKELLWWFVAAQPFHILYTIIAGWLGKFGSYTWKNRKVK